MNLSQLRFANAVEGIAQLAGELGARLFERTTRKVVLTSSGVQVLTYVNEVLNAQVSVVQQSQAFLRPGRRLIRIGTWPQISANLQRLMIEPYRQRNLPVDVALRQTNMTDVYRMLNVKLLDVVLSVTDVRQGPCSATFLCEKHLLVISRGAGWLKGAPPQSVEPKHIADDTYMMIPNACGLAGATRALIRSERRKFPEHSGEAMSYEALEHWATLGPGRRAVRRG